ncbi:MAG: response regulator transcription factor [Sedimentisphaerales bacterium]|nr:response regulator transcription factor [Sedimentisphaerales bacterium]
METVLIIEDDPSMLRGLKDNFEFNGYRVKTARDGKGGFSAALAEAPDLVILDITLPEMNGYEVCSNLRKKSLDVPIIMVTAKSEESDVVLGLNLGADDYVTKPFGFKELLARAQATMRRRRRDEPASYEFGNCQVDVAGCALRRGGKEVELTPGEFKMLHLFLRKAGCALTRSEIRDAVWGYCHFITLRDIDAIVTSVRNKVERDPHNPTFIRAVEGVGYKFESARENGKDTDN